MQNPRQDASAWSNHPFSSSNFLTKFSSLFFPRKTGKAGKTGNMSRVWKLYKRQNIWKASLSNNWKKKWKIWKYQKMRET